MRSFVFLSIVLCLVGCTSHKNPYDTAFVSGDVQVDGAPMEGVSVTFIPVSGAGQSAGGLTDLKGCFTLTVGGAPVGSGALEGEYDVTFSKYQMEGQELNFEEYRAKYGDRKPQKIDIIPEKYSDPRKSGIEPITVEKGKKNVFHFELSAK